MGKKEYTFSEHDVSITGPEEDLLDLADFIDAHTDSLSNKWTDLAYTIRYHLDNEFHDLVNQ